jgi:protein-tyrosine phosphatase
MARAVAPKFGVDLDNHRTTAMSQTLVDQADVILVMEPGQERQLETRFPGAGEKTFLLGPFSPDRPATEITDPYGGGAEDFDECYRILISACDGLLTYFTPDNTPGTDRSATRLLARSQPRSE